MSDAVFAREGSRGRVGPTARTLGFAGMLPQFATLWFAWQEAGPGPGQQFAFGYGALILSFLGGMWWGFAMRREAGQGSLVAIAVLPSLAAFFIALATVLHGGTFRTALIALGVAIMLTLVVDFDLFRRGEVPRGWMALRVPLSIGLGVLTVLAGLT